MLGLATPYKSPGFWVGLEAQAHHLGYADFPSSKLTAGCGGPEQQLSVNNPHIVRRHAMGGAQQGFALAMSAALYHLEVEIGSGVLQLLLDRAPCQRSILNRFLGRPCDDRQSAEGWRIQPITRYQARGYSLSITCSHRQDGGPACQFCSA